MEKYSYLYTLEKVTQRHKSYKPYADCHKQKK